MAVALQSGKNAYQHSYGYNGGNFFQNGHINAGINRISSCLISQDIAGNESNLADSTHKTATFSAAKGFTNLQRYSTLSSSPEEHCLSFAAGLFWG
jgi:hypothetical protein